MEIAFWFAFAAAMIFALLAYDKWHWYKKLESDLKDHLGDVMVAREVAPDRLRVHFDAQISSLKKLIRNHFDL